jgi:NitT/TauT family transport system ATP-binding protein
MGAALVPQERLRDCMRTDTDVPALSAKEIWHYFTPVHARRPFLALENINLAVARGSFVSLVGPSGCGKSTLLRVFAGLIRPTSGRVELGGEPIEGPDERKGMVFQEDAVFPWLSIAKNVEYGPRARGVGRSERQKLAQTWINMVGLAGFENAYPRELSGGMRKRVDLARVYASDPEILLMDEPFGALDALTKLKLQQELLLLWERSRKTVVFVTHDLEEATYLSDTVVVMAARPGRISSIHHVDIPRPRAFDVRATAQFTALTRQLWNEIESLEGAQARTSPG